MKLILHSDVNNFFASVETVMMPSLKNKPVAVAGSVQKRNGIVLAKNYPAKAKGVKTGDVLWEAKQKCPDIIFIEPNHSAYSHFSMLIVEIYKNYTDCIEPMGQDECWLDLTKTHHLFFKDLNLPLFEKGEKIAKQIQDEVFKKTGLGISVGVSYSKTLAKLGSDMKKPMGITVITPENYQEKILNLPIGSIMGVGRRTERKLSKMNVLTVKDYLSMDDFSLIKKFGKNGIDLKNSLLGLDTDEVGILSLAPPPKSVGNGTTLLRDITEKKDIESTLYFLCAQIARRLREQNLCTSCIGVTIKTKDFEYFSHDRKLPFHTNSERELFESACTLIRDFWDFKTPIRSVRVCTSRLIPAEFGIQQSLFSENHFNLDKAFDSISKKYGNKKLENAQVFSSDFLNKGEILTEQI